jgi:hypothetical protein
VTRDCKATRNEFNCATCKKDGRHNNHAAWDRECPAFIEEKAKLRERMPENHYRFFPVDHEEGTWVRHEESSTERNSRGERSIGTRYG